MQTYDSMLFGQVANKITYRSAKATKSFMLQIQILKMHRRSFMIKSLDQIIISNRCYSAVCKRPINNQQSDWITDSGVLISSKITRQRLLAKQTFNVFQSLQYASSPFKEADGLMGECAANSFLHFSPSISLLTSFILFSLCSTHPFTRFPTRLILAPVSADDLSHRSTRCLSVIHC